VWGAAPEKATVVSLKTRLGMLGAAEWRRKGLPVPGLKGNLHPHYGVYLPTRHDYVELLAAAPEVRGKSVFDVGTGTGVLSFILLQQGATRVNATDLDERAVACAGENAERLGWAQKFSVEKKDLFPEGRADLVVFNPPWIPEPPKNRVDRAVFDENSRALTGFIEGVRAHLEPKGRALLLLSNLAVLLGLRAEGWLGELLQRNGLVVASEAHSKAGHGKAHDQTDPLHEARSREVTTLYTLVAG
jgi:methylase of polypeptide subunit release factors